MLLAKCRAPVLCQIHDFFVLVVWVNINTLLLCGFCDLVPGLLGNISGKKKGCVPFRMTQYRTHGKDELNKYINTAGLVSLGLCPERQGEIGNSARRKNKVNDLRRAPADVTAQIYPNQ